MRQLPLRLVLHSVRITLVLVVFICRVYALDPSKPLTQYGHDIWDVHRGFPFFAIHALHQTRDGYLWLATDEGLVRFDGVQFTLFDSKNTPAITNNDISSLVEDSSGNLWFGTRGGGLGKLTNGEFTSYSTINGLPGNVVHSISPGRDNTLWVGMESFGLCSMVGEKFIRQPLHQPSGMVNVYTVFETKNGTVLAGAGGLHRRLPDAGSFEPVSYQAVSFIKTILEDRKGVCWIATNQGLCILEDSKIIQCKFPGAPVSESVSCLYEDSDGVLWVGTEGAGLFRLINGRFTSFTTTDGLSSNRVLSLTEDRDGNLWIGTRGGGINRLRNQTIRTITVDDGLSGDYITAVYEDKDGTLWIASKDYGLNEVSNTGVIRRYNLGNNVGVNHVRSIEEDAGGNLFIGTMKGIVVLPKEQGGKRFAFSPDNALKQLNSYSIRSIHIRSNGDMLIGSYGAGVLRYASGRLTKITESGNIRSIVETNNGSFWIAAKGAVSHVAGNTIKNYSIAEGLSSDEVFSIFCDDDSTVWVGTYGGGLNRIRNGTIVPIMKKDGLFDNVIYTILDDADGNFWMSSNRGVFRVRKQELNDLADQKINTINCTSYGYEDGMKSVECNGGSQPSGWKSKDGRLFFATVKGCVIIDPAKLQSEAREIVPTINLVIAEGDTLLPNRDMALPLGKRRLEIHYTGIAFSGAEKILFRYQLEGNDDSWNNAGTLRKAFYTNIAPGNYVFKVMANVPEGKWNGKETMLAITVPSYFWETTWFRVVMGLCLLLTVFGIARAISTRALKRTLREMEAQQALERERSRISKDMHDEVGASLTQIAILSELLERNITKRDAAEEYLKKISGTAHDVVASLDEIVWFINPKHDTLDSLILYLREYLANYFESVEINCRFEFPEQLPSLQLTADERRNIFLVSKEAAHNIVKHAGATEVVIKAEFEHDLLYLRIEDNGRGMVPERHSAFSDGLKNMRKRMEDVEGVFEITSKDGQGTVVVIKSKIKSKK